MTDDRKGGLALIAGMCGTLITMALHPTGRQMMAPGQADPVANLAAFVHGLAIACMPLLFLGALALSRRLASASRLALAALVFYSFSLAAVLLAATFSGFVAPGVVRGLLDAAPAARDSWHLLLEFTGRLNQAFAKVYVALSSAAILLWSIEVVRRRQLPRALGFYGLVLAPVAVAAVASGHIRLDVHGFGAIALTQAVWFVSAGAFLCRYAG